MKFRGWRLIPVRGDNAFVEFNNRPNWFHRLMWKLLLGVRWERSE